MHLAVISKIDYQIGIKDIVVQNIGRSHFYTFDLIETNFMIINKLGKIWFIQKSSSLANNNLEMIFIIVFFILSDKDVLFKNYWFIKKIYKPSELLPANKSIDIIDQEDFSKATLWEKKKTCMMYIAAIKTPIVILINSSDRGKRILFTNEEINFFINTLTL